MRDAEILVDEAATENKTSEKERNAKLPCRINVDLIGVEWFVYNRSPAYDSIIAGLQTSDDVTGPGGTSSSVAGDDGKGEGSIRSRGSKQKDRAENGFTSAKGPNDSRYAPNGYGLSEKASSGPQPSVSQDGDSVASGSLDEDEDDSQAMPELPAMIQFLPIHIRCEKAAAVIGNANTKGMLIVKADAVSADVDATKTQTIDPYCQVFKVQLEHPVVEMRDNEDFVEDQASQATRDMSKAQGTKTKPSYFTRQRRKVVQTLRRMLYRLPGKADAISPDSQAALEDAIESQIPGHGQWQGLSRYLDDEQDDKARWSHVEYAAETNVLDSPAATLTVFWDAVTKVDSRAVRRQGLSPAFRINGDKPPAWGMHLAIKGGSVNYGPWTDRRRADLQKVFFPGLSKDAAPAQPLKAGDWRVPTQFKLDVELDDDVTFRVPFREESKNWRWRQQETQVQVPQPRDRRRRREQDGKSEAAPIRPAAWLEAKVAGNTTVAYIMDMLASSSGYQNSLSVDLPSTVLRSVINQDLFWRSGAQRITCDMSNPLSWNTLREWRFTIDSDDLELYILRDHVFLLIDLINDWSSGPPPEYLVFTPFNYILNLNFRNLKLYLNVNDANIIDKPTLMDDNAFLILASPFLRAGTTISISKYRPDKSSVPFQVHTDALDMSFHAPQWNTQSAFVPTNELGHIQGLSLDGCYHYNALTAPGLTDTLTLSVTGQSAYAYIYGFVVRYFLLLKDNYFGDYVHFRTLDEYQEQLVLQQENPESLAKNRPPPKKSNDLDVILAVKVDNPKIMLPTNAYCSDRYIQAELASIAVDLRNTNYYMDMELMLTPLNLSLGTPERHLDSPSVVSSNTQLFIDGLRIFGHRAFGLPPTEPTYLCNWDVSTGAIEGECTADFLAALSQGGAAFGFTFDDVENALIPYSSLVFDDVTFARVRVESVRICLHVDDAAFLLSTDAIEIGFNDWARSHYSRKANISIPNVEISCMDAESAARHKMRQSQPVTTYAYFRTDIDVHVVGRKVQFSEKRRLQQELVRREDQRTRRTPFLLIPEYLGEFIPERVDPPSQCAPDPPPPIQEVDDEDFTSSRASSSRRLNRMKSQSSFLSFSTADDRSSVRRARSEYSKDNASILSRENKPGPHPNSSAPKLSMAAFTAPRGSLDTPGKDLTGYSAVSFTSQYYKPRFGLGGIRPDCREAPQVTIEEEDTDDFLNRTEAKLDDIDPIYLSEDHAYNSFLVEFPSGLTGFVKPAAIKHATTLLDALQPSTPEDVLDSLQTSTMTKLFDSKKADEMNGTITDLMIRLPKANVRFLNSSALDCPDPCQEEQDQYDFLVSQVAVVTRTVSDRLGPAKDDKSNSRTSLHLRVGTVEVSASERLTSLDEPQAAVMFQIEGIMISIGAKEVTYFDADIESGVGSTASGKVEYLASLIHRTGNMATELEHLITDTMELHENRRKYFIYRLLEEGHSTQDPSFLIRPSAVLRSATEHLRTQDSWKLAMRLRQIWSTMETQARNQLIEDCWAKPPAVPPDAAQLVIGAFQRWRSWDLENIGGSMLVESIFGRIENQTTSNNSESPILGACRLGEMQFVLDPGPKENRMGLTDLSARVDQKKNESENPITDAGFENGPLTVINVCCGEAAANLNWELCELVEDILKLYNRTPAEKNRISKSAKKKLRGNPKSKGRSALHVVAEITNGSVELETINLRSRSLSSGMKISILHYSNGENSKSTNAMLYYDAVTWHLHSHSQLLFSFQLRQPSIFISHELQQSDETTINTVKSSASSRGLKFVVEQDPVVLLEVADLLCQDELAQLHSLQAQVPASPKPDKPVNIKDHLSKFRLNVALFLDGYTITLPLVQSLTYSISGKVARAACSANFGKQVIFDFDIKENNHEMQIDVHGTPKRISLLQIPPTNGRIRSQIQGSENDITALVSIETMELDASALYSLLAALNRPQISNAVKEAQHKVKDLQGHMTDIFGKKEPTKQSEEQEPQQQQQRQQQKEAPKSSPQIVYNVHLALAGLQIFARTPLKSVVEPISQVMFSLDRFYLISSNRHEREEQILKYPEVHLNMKKVGFDVRRGHLGSMRPCGNISAGVTMSAKGKMDDNGKQDWAFDFKTPELDVSLSPETISTLVSVTSHLRERIKDLDTSRELDYLRKLSRSKPKIMLEDKEIELEETDILDSVLSSVVYNFELRNIRVCWLVASEDDRRSSKKEDLVLSIKLIEFGTRTKRSARLTIENFQLQTVPPGQDKGLRSVHSALLPEVIFNIAYVSTANARRMAFQAAGQSLDLRLTSGFIVPAANLVDSISLSIKNVREASAGWSPVMEENKSLDEAAQPPSRPRNIFGNKPLESLLIDADFDGAVVHVSSKRTFGNTNRSAKLSRPNLAGKYGQFNADDSGSGAILESPGLAWKVEYRDNAKDDPTLSGEIKISASSNILYPSVVPLVMDIVSSVKEVVSDNATEPEPEPEPPKLRPQKTGDEENLLTADPSAVLGRLKLNLGLRICRQEFSLSCQPIARVSATACFDGIYFTANTVSSQEHGNFFAISGTFDKLAASVQHVYSRESTGSFDIETITLSFMNSKHVSGTSGVSAILKVSPMRISVNAKQLQDFLLFREIWYPEELRQGGVVPVAKLQTETSRATQSSQQSHLVQRYQQVAATAAFPWTATISIDALDVSVDLGQTIGKSVFQITDFWVSSKKTSDWEQNLCLGFSKIGIDCTGRLSGFVALQDFKLRTSIQWPQREEALNETPLVQASIGFKALRLKAAFEYQAFLVADITALEFLMYNVRESSDGSGDRLVAIFDGEAVQMFGTTTSTSQAVALYRALKKLVQERRDNFESSLREIEKFMKRKTSATSTRQSSQLSQSKLPEDEALAKSPISLDTNVVVTLKALNLGVFPSTFSDAQVFKIEALNAYARFSASMEQARIHSILKMTLGQLRVGLASVRNVDAPKTLSEISVDDVVQRATGSRGGTILKVPRVSAVMDIWQTPQSKTIDYIFKSAFEGKVEVGWNYSRVSYIRGMWANHSKALEHVWGRELPMAAVKITGVPEGEGEGAVTGEQQKITAEVNVPQSKYNYVALEPPIIETPQLRDMGEATPPLEWIGLHRDKLPNLTHQIVIVSLLELAGEVEDAYSRILGSS